MKKILTLALIPLLAAGIFTCTNITKDHQTASLKKADEQGETANVISYTEEGEFTISWGMGIGSSYSLVGGGVLPSKANNNDIIKFKLVLSKDAETTPVVKVNDAIITPSDGVYEIIITGNTVITTSDLEISYGEKIEYSSFYLQLSTQEFVEKEENRLIIDKYPVYSQKQFYITGIDLKTGDSFKIFDKATSTYHNEFEEDEEGKLLTGTVAENTFTCTEDGTYALYIKETDGKFSIYVDCANETEVTVTGLDAGFTYYVWSWGGENANTWIAGEFANGNFTFVLPKGASGFLVAKFVEGTKIEDAAWGASSLISQTNDINPVKGKKTYTCTWKA